MDAVERRFQTKKEGEKMADFEVRTDSLKAVSENFSNVSTQVRNISNEAKRILSSTRGSITARIAYSLQRSVVCGNINNCSTDYKNLSTALKRVATLYMAGEKKVEGKDLFDEVYTLQDILGLSWDWMNSPIFDVVGVFPKLPISVADVIRPWSGSLTDKLWPKSISDAIADLANRKTGYYDPLYSPELISDLLNGNKEVLSDLLKATGITSAGATGSTLFKGFTDLGSFKNAMTTLFKDGKIAGSLAEGTAFINGRIAGIDAGVTAKGDVLGASLSSGGKAKWDLAKGDVGLEANIKGEVHLASGEAEASLGYLKSKIEGTVGSAEAKGSVGATLWKDGKFAPSIGVEGKASATVAEGEVETSFGTDNYNAHVSAEGSVLGAEAEASAKAGVITYEENGATKTKYGVEAKVGAEAYLAKGEVEGGFTLFGIEINASVEGKLGGAGASAGGEITTGGVGASLDLGLGAGVGVDISVDWSGFDISEVKETVNNTVDDIKDGLDALGDLFGF